MAEEVKAGTFRAFRNRNYALFFTGQTISQIGTWTQRAAVAWVIYTLTDSATMLGVTVVAQQLPSFLLSLLGGVVSDRYDRYKILLVTQTASMLQATLLAILVLTNHYAVWEILALSAMLGTINAFDTPARQPLVHEMINDKADLANAISFNSAIVNVAMLIGPPLAGILLLKFGAGVCFIINAVSFVAVISALLLMKFPEFKPSVNKKKIVSELVDGFKYLKQTPSLSMIVVLLTCLSFLVWPYTTIEPVFAKHVFNGNSATYGYISGSVGLGALIGALFLASARKGTNYRMILLLSIVILGTGLILFSRMTHLAFALPCAVIIGLATISPMAIIFTIIQMEADPKMRGRVMGFIAMAFFGMVPFGSLITGVISQEIGAPLTMLSQGIIAIIIAAVFYKSLRKVTPASKQV